MPPTTWFQFKTIVLLLLLLSFCSLVVLIFSGRALAATSSDYYHHHHHHNRIIQKPSLLLSSIGNNNNTSSLLPLLSPSLFLSLFPNRQSFIRNKNHHPTSNTKKISTTTMSNNNNHNKANVLMIGTGEYTTGYVGGTAADSDKGSGVVALTMFDLRRRNKVDAIGMCGVNGTKFPGIRQHMKAYIANIYKDMNISCDTYPSDTEIEPKAYLTAIQSYQPGDVAIIFTPDDTHYDIAMACIERGMHVMVTKPIVQTIQQHRALQDAANAKNVLVVVEVHKRYDPFYTDARDRIRTGSLGTQFQYMYSYMSQPKHQLDTFKAWAGTSSDISYYLNSHHIDWSEWTLTGIARPIRVTATASTGVAYEKDMNTEDSITLTVQWENLNQRSSDSTSTSSSTIKNKKSFGCAVYTSSWVAPKSDVHSQQRFFYMGNGGEINIDQAHRGCTLATDNSNNKGFQSINPLFMKYTPNSNGYFAGQNSYGYKSFELFIDCCLSINNGTNQVNDYDDGTIATIHTTLQGTAILEAGRMSLNNDGQPMDIVYENESSLEPVAIVPHTFL